MIGIIGAGPTGLAIAYLLKERGVEFHILERGSIGHTWKNQYESLHLNSIREVSCLPGLAMPKSYPVFPSAAQFASYLEQYARTFDLPVRTAEVQEVRPADPGFDVRTDRGTMHYTTVIIASGIWASPHHPYADPAPFRGEVLHASQYRTAHPFKGKRVLVVGAGSTASDIAVDLVENVSFIGMSIAHGVNIVPPITSPLVFKMYRTIYENAWLFHLLRPALVKMRADHRAIGLPNHPLADTQIGYSVILGNKLVDAVKTGQVHTYPAFTGFTAHGARFVDGNEVAFDTIIFATGYRPAVQFARQCFEMHADGYPIVDRYRSTKYKDLYLVCPGRDYEHNIGWLPSLERTATLVVNQILSASRR